MMIGCKSSSVKDVLFHGGDARNIGHNTKRGDSTPILIAPGLPPIMGLATLECSNLEEAKRAGGS
jgi:hypothetical protein